MAAKKTTTPAPEYDFDNWTEEAEEKAIAALVPQVKSIIVEKRFIGRFTDGAIVEVPLSLSLDDVDAMGDELSPVDQFKELLTRVGGETTAKEFTRHDIAETAILAEKYFRTLQRIQSAAFPE